MRGPFRGLVMGQILIGLGRGFDQGSNSYDMREKELEGEEGGRKGKG